MSGTLPDFYSSRDMDDDGDTNRNSFSEMAADQHRDGATFFRYTVDEPRKMLWVEGWKVEPAEQAPFDPPYTYSTATKGSEQPCGCRPGPGNSTLTCERHSWIP